MFSPNTFSAFSVFNCRDFLSLIRVCWPSVDSSNFFSLPWNLCISSGSATVFVKEFCCMKSYFFLFILNSVPVTVICCPLVLWFNLGISVKWQVQLWLVLCEWFRMLNQWHFCQSNTRSTYNFLFFPKHVLVCHSRPFHHKTNLIPNYSHLPLLFACCGSRLHKSGLSFCLRSSEISVNKTSI